MSSQYSNKSSYPNKASRRSWRSIATLSGVALAAGIFAFQAAADQWDKMTILSIDQPVQVQNTVLEPGKYMFKLANSDRHIVQIFTSDRKHLIDTIIAIPDYHLQPTSKSEFVFWETPTGSVNALKAWFYPGDNFGQEFRYPKHLRELTTTAAVTSAPAPAPAVVETTPQQPPAEPEPVAAAPAPAPTPEPQPEPVQIAQATPPPAPPAPQPEAQPAPAPQPPTELPHTATSFPLIGLGGVMCLAIFAMLRLKRLA